MLSGCGDSSARLPMGMTGVDAVNSGGTESGLFSTDPGPLTPTIARGIDDPILAEYNGIDDTATLLTRDDPFARAVSDWNDHEGMLADLGSTSLEDSSLDSLNLDLELSDPLS